MKDRDSKRRICITSELYTRGLLACWIASSRLKSEGLMYAGDKLTFVDFVSNYATWFSDSALNADNGNHVFSATAPFGQAFTGSPARTYVAFEDLFFPNSDFNYFDNSFVYSISSAVPEMSTWGMMIAGFAGVTLLTYRRRKLVGD